MARHIQDYFNSGEAKNLILTGNIGYLAVQDSAYNGMFLRVENGITGLYKAPDQDIHWEDIDGTQRELDQADTKILEITTDAELNATNGSYMMMCMLEKSGGGKSKVDIHAEINGSSSSSIQIEIEEKDGPIQAVLNGSIDSTIPAGAVINIWFDCDTPNVNLKGDILETRLKVTAAQSAPVVITVDQVNGFDWNQLPSSNPHVWGQLYTKRQVVKVSEG